MTMSTPTTRHPPRRKKRPTPPRAAAPSSAPDDIDTSTSASSSFIELNVARDDLDAAYFLAEQRDFCPGHEVEDWLAAEREIDRFTSGAPGIGFGS
jgi:hypothetical protein